MKSYIWQLQTAESHFTEVINKALNGQPQIITKNGKPVVYIVAYETYQRNAMQKSKKEILLNRPNKDIEIIIQRDKDTGRKINL